MYILIYLAFSVALTRMRAQLGPPSHEMAFVGPNQIIVDVRGTQGLAASTVSRTVTLFHFMNRTHRTDPMPGQLEAMKMSETARVNQRVMFFAIVVATVAGSVCGQVACICVAYHRMPKNWGGEPASVATQLIDSPRAPNTTAMAVIAASCAFVLLLDFLRFRVPGFPLHPAGYALSGNFGVDYYWFGLLVVLLIKGLVQRYGGLKAYRRLREVAPRGTPRGVRGGGDMGHDGDGDSASHVQRLDQRTNGLEPVTGSRAGCTCCGSRRADSVRPASGARCGRGAGPAGAPAARRPTATFYRE